MVAIILDHLNFFPNGLDWWSARGSLFVTTAEGFFLISGIVLGIVRGAKLVNEPFRRVAKLLLKRGLQLYLTSIILVLIFTLVGWWFFINSPGLKVGIIPPGTNFFEVLWKVVTLQYIYGWADYLRLYAIFLLASPLVMWCLRKGRWYVVLIASFLLWTLFPADPTIPDQTQELLQPLSWQLLFFGGMTIGFYWQNITTWWRQQNPLYTRTTRWTIVILAAVTIFCNVIITFGPIYFDTPHLLGLPADLNYKLYIGFFDKERLPLTRLLLFILWFWAAFFVFKRFEPQIKKWLGWLLLPFGTNSLYVYTVHAFIIFFVHLWLSSNTLAVNFLVAASIILLIRLMIHYQVLMKVIPR